MASNVYTKNEILQTLASKGYFIDAYTLDTFFVKWNIEAIFEDEQGSEFYDKNALDLILSNLFNAAVEEKKEEPPVLNSPQKEEVLTQSPAEPLKETQSNSNFKIEDNETKEILSNISLSDGSPLIDKIGSDLNINTDIKLDEIQPVEIISEETVEPVKTKKKMGILEGAILSTMENAKPPEEEKKEEKTLEDFQNQTQQIVPENNTLNIQEVQPPMPSMPNNSNDNGDFDDISLLSDSLEAQEKFREYVATEFAKKNPAPAQQNNEFKLDISERTINMIARTMAKKIAKHVSSICSADAKSMAELEGIKSENKKLEQKAKELENQNKKLKLLLAESNKNLNSYKPSIFGLYKKVPPTQ